MTDESAAAWVGLLLLCIYLVTAGGHYGGDGFWSYLTAESLVLDGDVRLGDRPFLIREMVNQFTEVPTTNRDGESGWQHSKYGLGLALVEVPFYIAGLVLCHLFPSVPADYITMFTVSLTNTVVSALWCVLFLLYLRRVGFSRSTSVGLTLALGLGSPVFPYASYGFSEPLVGLCLLGAVLSILRSRKHGTFLWLLLTGSLIGMAFVAKYYALIVLPTLSLYLWFSSRPGQIAARLRGQVALYAGFVPFALMGAVYNYARYGSLMASGYSVANHRAIGGFFDFSPFELAVGLYGLLLSSGRGLLIFMPIAFLAPSAFAHLLKRNRNEAILTSTLILVHLLFYAGFVNWDGGSSWGPRFLLPIVPFVLLPAGVFLESPAFRKKVARCLIVLGFLCNVPVTLVNYHQFIRFIREQEIGYTNRPGGTLLAPWASPIIGSYYQAASAMSRALSGRALSYPVASSRSGLPVSMAGYDQADLWWLNVSRSGLLGRNTRRAIYLTVLLSGALAVYSYRRLRRWTPSKLAYPPAVAAP